MVNPLRGARDTHRTTGSCVRKRIGDQGVSRNPHYAVCSLFAVREKEPAQKPSPKALAYFMRFSIWYTGRSLRTERAAAGRIWSSEKMERDTFPGYLTGLFSSCQPDRGHRLRGQRPAYSHSIF